MTESAQQGVSVTDDEIIEQLDALNDGDPEVAHGLADELLAKSAPPAVAEAWERAHERVGFWCA